jgi:hypothetical protein
MLLAGDTARARRQQPLRADLLLSGPSPWRQRSDGLVVTPVVLIRSAAGLALRDDGFLDGLVGHAAHLGDTAVGAHLAVGGDDDQLLLAGVTATSRSSSSSPARRTGSVSGRPQASRVSTEPDPVLRLSRMNHPPVDRQCPLKKMLINLPAPRSNRQDAVTARVGDLSAVLAAQVGDAARDLGR